MSTFCCTIVWLYHRKTVNALGLRPRTFFQQLPFFCYFLLLKQVSPDTYGWRAMSGASSLYSRYLQNGRCWKKVFWSKLLVKLRSIKWDFHVAYLLVLITRTKWFLASSMVIKTLLGNITFNLFLFSLLL